MASPLFRINGGTAGVKAAVSAASAVTATLDSTVGVSQVEWFIDTTDDTTAPGDYTLVQSGSVGQTVSTTSLTAGTAAKIRCRINGGNNSAGYPDPENTNAKSKFYVVTSFGREVGCAGEEYESDATNGSTGIINAAVRETGSTAIIDIIATAPITESGTTTRTIGIDAATTIAAGSMSAADKTLLDNATSAATAGTLVKRGAVDKEAAFGYLSVGATPASAGDIRLTAGASIQSTIGGADMPVLSDDASGNITLGGSNTESLRFLAATNKNITGTVDGTGTASLAASGASSTVSLTTNGVTVLSGTGGNVTLDSTATVSLKIAGTALCDFNAAGLTFENSLAPTIGVDSVAAGDGKNILVSAGNVTAGAGMGGSVAMVAGTNAAGDTGNVVAYMALGSGGDSGEFQCFDGTNVFFKASDNATTTTLTVDRALAFNVDDAATIASGTSGTGDLILSVANTERLRLKTTGLEFEKGNTFSVTQPQSTSGAGRNLTIQAQRGIAGTDGGNLILSPGDAGTAASDLQGEVVVALGNSGDLSGIMRLTAGVHGDLLSVSYDDGAGDVLLSCGKALNITTTSDTTIQSTAGNIVLDVDTALTIRLDVGAKTPLKVDTNAAYVFGGAGLGTGVGVMTIANATTAPTTNPTGGGLLYSEGGAGKWRGSGGTVTTFGPAEPHCPRCGSDFAHQWRNDAWGKRLAVCIACLVTTLENAGVDVGQFAFEKEGI